MYWSVHILRSLGKLEFVSDGGWQVSSSLERKPQRPRLDNMGHCFAISQEFQLRAMEGNAVRHVGVRSESISYIREKSFGKYL